MTKPSELDCENNDYPVCPHCGHVIDSSADYQEVVVWEDDGISAFNCEECRGYIVCATSVEYTFTTHPACEKCNGIVPCECKESL